MHSLKREVNHLSLNSLVTIVIKNLFNIIVGRKSLNSNRSEFRKIMKNDVFENLRGL